MHIFEVSGLGSPPFRLTTNSDDFKDHAFVFWCEHCGTSLINRHFIKSNDGVISVVGVDCLKKSGDEGLISQQKQIALQIRSDEIDLERKKFSVNRIASEREANNGLTNYEMAQGFDIQHTELLEAHQLSIVSEEVFTLLGDSNFEEGMKQRILAGEMLTTKQVSIIAEIITKKETGSRKNSKEFKSKLPYYSNKVNELQSTLESVFTIAKSIRVKYLEYRNK